MQQRTPEKKERGAVLVLIAVATAVLLTVAALAIDVGYSLATKSQLQNAADAGGLAGINELAGIYREHMASGDFDYTQYTLADSEQGRIAANVNQFTQQNRAAGVAISVPVSDIVYGRWDSSTSTFTPTLTGVDALTVDARRDEQANGSLPSLLAGIVGVKSYAIKADVGVNLLSGLRSTPEGKGDVPFGISKAWFDDKACPCGEDSHVRFYPTGDLDGCAGWHVFDEIPASAAKLRGIIQGLEDGTYTTPETTAGETYLNFNGGSIAAAFPYFIDLFNSKKGADGTWKVHVPVYDQADCANPHGMTKIVGFATARITRVTAAPTKQIDADVECDIVDWGRGGGPSFGTSVEAIRVIR